MSKDTNKTFYQKEFLKIQTKMHDVETHICAVYPRAREISLAMTKLQEAMFWLNQAQGLLGELDKEEAANT